MAAPAQDRGRGRDLAGARVRDGGAAGRRDEPHDRRRPRRDQVGPPERDLGCLWLVALAYTLPMLRYGEVGRKRLVLITAIPAYANWLVTTVKSFFHVAGRRARSRSRERHGLRGARRVRRDPVVRRRDRVGLRTTRLALERLIPGRALERSEHVGEAGDERSDRARSRVGVMSSIARLVTFSSISDRVGAKYAREPSLVAIDDHGAVLEHAPTWCGAALRRRSCGRVPSRSCPGRARNTAHRACDPACSRALPVDRARAAR